MTLPGDPSVSPASPPVSFVVLGYNQADLIEKTIASAFAQTYQPLQIVLSDDGSKDATFEIMQAMAAAYAGPHTVLVRRSSSNRGTLRHVMDAVAASCGEFIVISAGDDISLPERTSVLVEEWRRTGQLAICSDYQIIDPEGAVLQPHARAAETTSSLAEFLPPGFEYQPIHGATSSYDRRIFDLIADVPTEGVFWEDMVINLALLVRGYTVGAVALPLVQYRVHPGAEIGRFALMTDVAEFERARLSLEKNRKAVYECLLAVSQVDAPQAGIVDRQRLRAEIDWCNDMVRWREAGFLRRLAITLSRPGSALKFRWKLVRLWGRFPNYWPRVLLPL